MGRRSNVSNEAKSSSVPHDFLKSEIMFLISYIELTGSQSRNIFDLV